MTREELDREIERTPNGKEKMALLRKGWEMADREKDYDGQIEYRLEYMSQAAFYDDVLEIYIVYPEVLRLHDNYIKESGYDYNTRDILWNYKWLLENAADFYQISIQQFEAFFEDCKRRYMENNYSLRPLYGFRFIFYANINQEKCLDAYKEFNNLRRDHMSDCHACERSKEVDFYLGQGELGKALTKAAPVVDGQLTCAEQPECTLGAFMRYYNEQIVQGDTDYIEPASELCETLRKIIEKKGTATFHIPDILFFYAMEKPEKALKYYAKNCTFFENNRNPVYRYHFAIAALAFLKNLGDKKTYKMKLPSDFALYRSDHVYDVKELRNYYYNGALEIAKKMDERNGTTVFQDTLSKMISV